MTASECNIYMHGISTLGTHSTTVYRSLLSLYISSNHSANFHLCLSALTFPLNTSINIQTPSHLIQSLPYPCHLYYSVQKPYKLYIFLNLSINFHICFSALVFLQTHLSIQTLSHLIQSFPCPSSLLTPYREDFFNIYFLQTFYQSPLMPFCPCLPSKAPINTQNPCLSYTVLPLKCSIPIE